MFSVTVQQNRKHFDKLCLWFCRLYCLPHWVADSSTECLIKCTYTCVYSFQSFSWSSSRVRCEWAEGKVLWFGFFFPLKIYSYCIFLLKYELDQDKDFFSSQFVANQNACTLQVLLETAVTSSTTSRETSRALKCTCQVYLFQGWRLRTGFSGSGEY